MQLFALLPLALVVLASTSAAHAAVPHSARQVTHLHGKRLSELPPLAPAVIEELAKRDPKDIEYFHNDLSLLRALSGAESDPVKRAVALSGLQTRCTASHCFSLTFDDGPYTWHQEIANDVANAGYLASFMVNGFNWDCIYDAPQVQSLRRSLNLGHQIASHTWSHPHMVGLTYAQIDEQVELIETALLKTAGVVPAFIRPPYGEVNDTIVQYLNEKHGLIVVNWNYDTEDASGATVDYSLNVIKNITAPTHAIVLQHETVNTTHSELVPQELPIIAKNGYTMKNVRTLAQNFGVKPYKVVTSHGSRDSSWTCDGTPVPGQG
ncbi:carbohydrate esterase family 4 protein [Tilletiaria anomala UBC 951]|uniref:Carbohydrate esterase family 4 protein n=1 Tax=Tilletiaria anomala (strain ATCC 24038 / CBS 436.72 / UBC 951) TaxID=1037660 RepID=A0A066WQA7_TILAU|nr:carbohydrate esterase family 4 protein [Tilletiaria anomala UBC 951]KDN52805.1 carbohydrate esterase family 4 protein [Tilletiaria anomala UBC 951]